MIKHSYRIISMVTHYWILKEFEIFGIVFYTKVIGKCKDDYCGIVPFFSLKEAEQYMFMKNRKKKVKDILWVNPSNRLPIESGWFICYVNEERLPVRFNSHNNFWARLDGKCYKVTEIDKWLDA